MIVFAKSEVLDFDLVKMPTQSQDDPHVLIISGIQGDEPGGFNATNLFLQHYKIKSGKVWVIPNLNKHSILKNHRGIYGDMNRKFQILDSQDAEYELVQKIKQIILDPQIQVVYHLHDGGGFYRKQYIDRLRNPKKWGNCSIIDQERLEGSYYENLLRLSEEIIQNINAKILNDLHKYHTRNTETRLRDKEMEKSLTFFAIEQGKTALANEASKNLPLHERVYYHLLGIEGMLNAVGVKFERDFDLTPKKIYSLLYDTSSYVEIGDSIKLPLFGLRANLGFFPLPKNIKISQIKIRSNHYIVGFVQQKSQIVIKYGNRVVSRLDPFFVEFSNALSEVKLEIDGVVKKIKIGEIVKVKDYFMVQDSFHRVNIIGFHGKNSNEAHEIVRLKNIVKKFSIDRAEKKYRVEFYDSQNRFLGMIIVDFS